MAVTVATLNLKKNELRWGERAPLLVRELIEVRRNVIGFQEVDLRIDQGNWICGRLNDLAYPQDEGEYRIHHMANPRDNVTLEALAIMTRLPVVDHEGFDYLFRNRVAHRARMDLGGAAFDFWNTHFHHELDQAANEVRSQQAEKLVTWIAARSGDTPAVLVGDFNCIPGTRPLRTIGARLTSVFDTLGREPPTTVPTPLDPKPYPGEWTIDHIFASPNVRVLDAGRTFDEPDQDDKTLSCSDHYGLVATIEVA